MELQVSYSICTKVQKKSVLWRKRAEIGQILRELCSWKKVNIINAEVCPEHVHMLIAIPPKYSVSSFMGGAQREEQCYDIREMGELEI